ncbi:MAG: PIN domain-containing protein [Chloroflexi bacterium]|nr:PIN domain-containing protein [Chloroflexota bacterium]
MAALYLVDTSVWIFATRRSPRPAIVGRLHDLIRQNVVATCGLIQLELLGRAVDQAEYALLGNSLAGLHRLPILEEDWMAAAGLAFRLRRVGVTIPFTDALLAALAIRDGAVLVHADRDFDLAAQHTDLQTESLVHLVSSA